MLGVAILGIGKGGLIAVTGLAVTVATLNAVSKPNPRKELKKLYGFRSLPKKL